MIVRTLEEVIGSPSHIHGDGWQSRRLLLRADAAGFSVHDTVLAEGTAQESEYKNHIEANYCVSGEGEVTDLTTGITYPVRPGTIYVLENHERHVLRATKGDLRLVCVFNPALVGNEVHQADGSYASPGAGDAS